MMADDKAGSKEAALDIKDNDILDHINRRPTITVDYERYAHMLENSDLTKNQKQELLQALWDIVTSFVQMGVGVHPVQQAQNARGKLQETKPKNGAKTNKMIQSTPTKLTTKFNKSSGQEEKGVTT